MLLELVLLLTSPRSPLDPRPRLTDLVRFPPYPVAIGQYTACKQHIARLHARPVITYQGRLARDRAVAETQYWHDFWDLLTDAQATNRDEKARLAALDRLEELIGCGLYRQGWSPPLLPAGLPD